MSEPAFYSYLPSPIGDLLLVSDGSALTALHMPAPGRSCRPEAGWQRNDERLRPVREQLEDYFAGRRTGFELPLAPHGTVFQLRVWAELRRIPFGTTMSYAEIARRVGQPGAARAVGAANGRNPIAIIVPCHRVIGADGTLTGFGGGLDRKRWLLEHEGVQLASRTPGRGADKLARVGRIMTC